VRAKPILRGALCFWLLSLGVLSRSSAAQELPSANSATPDIASRVQLVPGEFAQVQQAQQNPPPPQTSPSQQPSPQPQPPQPPTQQQTPEQQSGTSHDRLFWALPNFLTVENSQNIPPLTAGQKFKVVARGVFDPAEFVLVGFVAGLGQAVNSDPAYGQGAQGYAKRYGTAYGDNAIENFMASAVFPSLLHQDPRYFQLGHGGFWKRTEHALGRVVITRSDSGATQVNYSELLGAGSAAAISTFSYHPNNERSAGNVATVWVTQMGWDAATYMIKEFWPDLRKKPQKNKQ
jgi:hypothetical protein